MGGAKLLVKCQKYGVFQWIDLLIEEDSNLDAEYTHDATLTDYVTRQKNKLKKTKQRKESNRDREEEQKTTKRKSESMNFEGYVGEDDEIMFGGDLTVHEEVPVDLEMAADEDSKILIENSVVTLGSEDGEMVGISDGGDITVHELNGNDDEPYIGTKFESEEAAKIYYATYARRIGFITRVGNCHRSGRDNAVISRRFLCNKEGFRLNSNKIKRLEGRKPRAITREGCKAMIMVRKEKSGMWIITKLETEHSHPLGIPSNKNHRVYIQARPQDEKDKKIRELSAELHRANQQLADCRQQLDMILNDIERHTNHLTKSIEEVVEQVKELESEDQDYSSYQS